MKHKVISELEEISEVHEDNESQASLSARYPSKQNYRWLLKLQREEQEKYLNDDNSSIKTRSTTMSIGTASLSSKNVEIYSPGLKSQGSSSPHTKRKLIKDNDPDNFEVAHQSNKGKSIEEKVDDGIKQIA